MPTTSSSFRFRGTLIVPNIIPPGGLDSQALFFRYPEGGKATKKITKGVKAAQGAVVRLAPSH